MDNDIRLFNGQEKCPCHDCTIEPIKLFDGPMKRTFSCVENCLNYSFLLIIIDCFVLVIIVDNF